MSEAKVKTNRIRSTKWIHLKEQTFANDYFIFLNFCFSLRIFYKELIWYINYSHVHIHTFRKRRSFIWGYFFLVSILKCHLFRINWGRSAFVYSYSSLMHSRVTHETFMRKRFGPKKYPWNSQKLWDTPNTHQKKNPQNTSRKIFRPTKTW